MLTLTDHRASTAQIYIDEENIQSACNKNKNSLQCHIMPSPGRHKLSPESSRVRAVVGAFFIRAGHLVGAAGLRHDRYLLLLLLLRWCCVRLRGACLFPSYFVSPRRAKRSVFVFFTKCLGHTENAPGASFSACKNHSAHGGMSTRNITEIIYRYRLVQEKQPTLCPPRLNTARNRCSNAMNHGI